VTRATSILIEKVRKVASLYGGFALRGLASREADAAEPMEGFGGPAQPSTETREITLRPGCIQMKRGDGSRRCALRRD
jgi:hypothetical protein